MEFRISRASKWTPNPKLRPCDGATWDADSRDWFIEIESLESLVALMDKVDKDIVLLRSTFPGEGLSIVIYDDHME